MKRAAALVLGASLGACGGPAPGPPTPSRAPAPRLLTVASAATRAADPVVGLAPGSRLLLVDPGRPDAAPIDLAEGFFAAGAPCVSFDAERIAFVARRSAAEPWGLWTCRADGTDRRPAVSSATDLAAPAWLPDGRLVYAGALDEAPPSTVWERAWALHVAPADGTAGQRITFGAGLDLDPCVLPDGRVLYATWRPPASEGAEGRMALFTVHPDGSGCALFHAPPEAPAVLRRPRVAPDGGISYLGGEGTNPEDVYLVEARWPYGAPARPTSEGAADLRAVELAPRPPPQGHLSFVDPYATWGQLVGLDARFPATSAAAEVLVRRYDGPSPGDPVVLVRAPLAADGSFFLRVPPDTPLLVDVLDAQGRPLSRSTTPIWVRPRESRACVGCHEAPDLMPLNRRPQACQTEPVGGAR